MTLLTLDQSSHITGYSVFKDNKLFTYGKFTLDNDDIGIRLTQLRQKINNLLEEYRPDEAVIEDIQLQGNVTNNVQTFKILAQVQGVIIELLVSKKIKYSLMLASTWKSRLGIKGKTRAEQKRNAQQYIVQTYTQKPTQDECDSLCIGLAHIQTKGCAWAN